MNLYYILQHLTAKLAGCIDLTHHPLWGSTEKVNQYVKKLRNEWNKH